VQLALTLVQWLAGDKGARSWRDAALVVLLGVPPALRVAQHVAAVSQVEVEVLVRGGG
jgi:hypothetical protein